MNPSPDEPLTMTVHTLPQPGQVVASDAARTRTGRWKMLLLLLVCAAPVVASYFTYYVIRPQSRNSYGELIDPQRPLPAYSGVDAAGAAVPMASLKNQWLLVSVADTACDADCERHLYLQRQIREMLGREKERLDWVWLRTGDQPMREALAKATEAAIVLKVDANDVAAWLEPAPGHRVEDHLYVVDPMGNWMMRFPADIDPKKARRDLDRLLRASSFWDKAGR
ncbi:MAG: hypothetical protein R3E99_11175 [Burkholderiaceae bacterium]